ncbi:uncharacterized protein LOC110848058 isoform X2 [Folsomia candida]|uniref:uncharacterized protein LOC110848058 isoform X2 n=1 Tax=Folsomia candida TaxID=158441 RepID=UPI000B902F92|nr:uncharacterized protein LOC110848058 isoform X2 [Folsomia candida]
MGDDNESMDMGEGATTSSAPQGGIDAAAQLRERRRQKILANQSSRMNKIMGVASPSEDNKDQQQNSGRPEGDNSLDEVLDWATLSHPGERIVEEKVDNGVSIIRRRINIEESSSSSAAKNDNDVLSTTSQKNETLPIITTASTSSMRSASTSIKSNSTKPKVTFAPSTKPPSDDTPSPRQRPAYGFMAPQADGSTLHPKLSSKTCRVLIFFLGIFLSIFNTKYFLMTFCSWELAVFIINGFPNDENPSSNFILLIALFGMKDEQLQKFKFVFKLFNTLITDFSILMVSTLMSRVVLENWLSTLK